MCLAKDSRKLKRVCVCSLLEGPCASHEPLQPPFPVTSLVSFCSPPPLESLCLECLSYLTARIFHLNANWQADSTPDSHRLALLAAGALLPGQIQVSGNVRLLKGPVEKSLGSVQRAHRCVQKGPHKEKGCQGGVELGGRWDREALFAPVSPPYRWESSETAAQTSVQMDEGHSPRTLRRLGVRSARRGRRAKSGGNGNEELRYGRSEAW